MARSTWSGRPVLVTGHTGFKGAWLTAWLEHLGAEVTGLSLPAAPDAMYKSTSSWNHTNIEEDLLTADLDSVVARAQPDVVFHLAAQSTVRTGYSQPEQTWATNVMGTVRLLDALRDKPPTVALVTTTDKVYGSAPRTFDEQDRLVASDPYAGSKVGQEMVVASFRDAYFHNRGHLVTARAGNVIGGGDAGPDRLIPDAVRASRAGQTLELRSPEAVRPWQHVLDPVWGYLRCAEYVLEAGTAPYALNFGPDPTSTTTVAELVTTFLDRSPWDSTQILTNAPDQAMAENPHLTIDSTAAADLFGWSPRLSTPEAVAWTADWYSAVEAGSDPLETTKAQIVRYEGLAG